MILHGLANFPHTPTPGLPNPTPQFPVLLPQRCYYVPMATTETTPAHIFTDARQMYDSARERLAAGDIRDAADKAWCATLRATDALVLARTGQQPPTSPATTRAFLIIGEADPAVRRLQGRFFQRQSVLHGNCFYMGCANPLRPPHVSYAKRKPTSGISRPCPKHNPHPPPN